MKLVLELLGPPRLMGARRRCELRMGSLLVGRSPEADWVIPDSERMVSRLHLRIDSAHGDFMLTDTSANGVYMNDGAAPVGYGASVKLRDGDRLQIGDARIAVTVEARVGPSAAADPDVDADRPPALPPEARDPLGGPFGVPSSPPEAPAPRAADPGPAPRGAIDANWMIEPVGPPPTRAPPRTPGPTRDEPPAPTAGASPGGREAQDGGRGVPALVDAHPGLSARALAAAVEAASRALDPSARSALLAEIAAFLERGR